MFCTPRRTRRLVRRLSRPAVLLVLVLAQAATALGFPVVRSCGGRAGPCGSWACGCESACGRNEGCCCRTGMPAPEPKPAPPPVTESCVRCGGLSGACCCPEPEPAACPKCRAKQNHAELAIAPPPAPVPVAEAGSVAELKWVMGWQVRQCHGDGPLGLFADLPAVPPAPPSRPVCGPLPAGTLSPADSFLPSRSVVPVEPPPRCG